MITRKHKIIDNDVVDSIQQINFIFGANKGALFNK